MFPAARLVVHLRPVHPDHVEEEALCQAVLAQHLGRMRPTRLGQLEATIAHHVQQAVTLHARDRLRNRRAGVPQAVDDARTQGGDPVLLELEDGLEVHLGGVDQVCHVGLLYQAGNKHRIGSPSLLRA